METGYFQGKEINGRGGFVGGLYLVLVISVALMFAIYVAYTGAFNPFAMFQGTEGDRYSDPNAYPWEEEHLFVNKTLDGYDMGGRRPPFRSQPRIEDELYFRAEVYDDGNQLGEIELTIFKDFYAKAVWPGSSTWSPTF